MLLPLLLCSLLFIYLLTLPRSSSISARYHEEMEMLTASSTLRPLPAKFQRLTPPPLSGTLITTPSLLGRSTRPLPLIVAASSAARKEKGRNLGEVEEKEEEEERGGETLLYSVAPYPLLLAALLPGAGTVRSIFDPFVELIKTWNLPDWLVHWGHPGNMAVVLFAMGGYGTYLGFRIRLSKDADEKAKAKDLHPKLLGGMFFFFALGATGGITALLTSNKPIFESPHAVSGFIGLSLLTVQSILPVLFEENPGMRTVHGLLGSSIMTLFLIHAALGLQLGLSF